MSPVAIFEEEVKKDANGQVYDVRGWVGPEEGVTVPQNGPDGKPTGVSRVEYKKYARYHVQFRGDRLSYWRICFIDDALVNVYEAKGEGEFNAMELEGMTAAGILRVAQIINAIMSLAAEYTGKLENQAN